MSDTNSNKLSYKAETTYGTAVTGDYQYLPYLSWGVQGTPTTVQSQEITTYRDVTDLLKTGFDVGGDMGFELGWCATPATAHIYDELFEAALCGTWNTNVLKIGSTTNRSFTFEREFNDWTGNVKYIVYTGMKVGGFNLNVAYGALISGGFNFMGAAIDTNNTATAGGTRVAIPTHNILSSAQVTFGSSAADGDLYGACASSFTLQLENNLRKKECIGSTAVSGVGTGSAVVTGSMSVYFEDNMALYDKLINGTATDLTVVLNSAGSNAVYTIWMENVKYSGGGPEDAGRDNFNMLTLNFQALYDATDTSLQITRAFPAS